MTEEGVRLRPAGTGDEALLERVYASTRAEELALAAWSPEQKQAFLSMQFRAQHDHYRRHYAGASFDVIEIDGEAAGRLYVARGESEVRIVDIALLPAWRGQGVGTALLRALMDEAAGAGKLVTVHVEQTNPAMRLYLRLGFEPVADHGIHRLLRWSPPGAAAFS